MSGDVLTTGSDGPATTAPGDRNDSGGTWTLTANGVATVMRLELRQRIRATRWVVVLVVWTAIIGGLTGLIWMALGPMSDSGANEGEAGSIIFGIIVFLVLTLGSLVAPALSATSINGDRNAGVLATLQTTLLSPAEIAVGKLLAAWTTALALFVTSAPFIVFAYFLGGTPLGRLLVVLVLLALMLGVVCAVGLGWSAIAARTSTSSVLTYLTVALLGPGLPLLFALSLPFVTVEEKVTVRSPSFDVNSEEGRCVTTTETMDVSHTELTWWILAASPYVVVSDAAPPPSNDRFGDDPLTGIRNGVRELRLGPEENRDWCSDTVDNGRATERESLSSTWPYGLAIDLLLAAGFAVLTVRRLRTPTRRLPRGTRVA
jgi:ABC-type transport system involved in multi-copper enzyme maturation permease subunit